jgi:TetR/AcrR family transcriptional regulator, transcriptional repressor for nem operon
MGHSQAEKAQTHERIVQIAATRLRERGLEGIGVAELMKAAGLTVGGFYKHFASRDDLVAEAIGSIFSVWQDKVDAAAANGVKLTFTQLVDDYLSHRHRDDPGGGCVFSALAADLARGDAKTRAIATEQIRRDLALLAGLLANQEPGSARDLAILAFSAMVGAVSLARVVSSDALSHEILQTVGGRLKAMSEP